MPQKNGVEQKNPVIKIVGGIEIRKNNTIRINYSETEFERLARQSLITGLPIAKIVAISSQPCPVCGNDHIDLVIPLGLLSVRKQGNHTRHNSKARKVQGEL